MPQLLHNCRVPGAKRGVPGWFVALRRDAKKLHGPFKTRSAAMRFITGRKK